MNNYIFTSESVSDGHPDKVADQISDALVDAGLANGDETTRVAVETLVTTNHVTVAGEVKNFNVSRDEVKEIIRDKVREIGYEQDGFHWDKLNIYNEIHAQSGDIGTDDFGAGDQGIMFGYANRDNEAYLPAPIYYSHQILKQLKQARQNNDILLPDAKSQVSVEYRGDQIQRIDQVVVSTQHTEGNCEEARKETKLIAESVLGHLVDDDTVWHLNPTGNFVVGGPDGDSGLTGRKIIVDTYGGLAPHGGGAFSGKDPSKVDRSAAYMARYLAKNIVATGRADWATIQLSYAIGVEQPTSVYVESDRDSRELTKWITENVDLSPKGIIDRFDLFSPIYSSTTNYGHFGKDYLPWEQINLFPEESPKKKVTKNK